MNVANDAKKKKYKIALKTITFSEISYEIIPFHYSTYMANIQSNVPQKSHAKRGLCIG